MTASWRDPLGVAGPKQKIVYVVKYADGTHLGDRYSRVGRQSAIKFESAEAAERRAMAIAAVRTWEYGLNDFVVEEFVRRPSKKGELENGLGE